MIQKTRTELVEVSTVQTPQGEDINSLAQGHDPEIFTHLLKNRKPYRNGPNNKQSSFSSIETNGSTEKEKAATGHVQEGFSSTLNTSNPEYITYKKEGLKFTLLGGISLQQIDRLRVTLKLNIEPQLSPLQSIRHNIDLYNDDQVEKFCRKAAEKLETGTSQVAQITGELIEALERYRLSKLESESQKEVKPKKRILSAERRKAALDYLKAPKLLKRTNADIAQTGVIGEEVNRLLMYLVFTSRLREQPLHIISLGSSGTGKTYLQERIGELIPEQDKLEITILSDNAFYYFGQKELQNKLVLIEDMDGAENVLYPLRELMTKKRISKRVVIKDSKGNMRTVHLQVEGPICVGGTTTREQLYEDNANRSLLIYLDGSQQHQEQIMNYQRALSAGEINHRQEDELKELFRDMQSLLKPVKVRNPYARLLKIPPEVFKPLRSNGHYLQFIECVSFYHQYQREVKTNPDTGGQYIETTLEDIEAANALLKDVLLAKADELSGECRRFFEKLKAHLQAEKKAGFYSKEIRTAFRMNPHNLKYYINQLVRYGMLKVVGGNRYKQGLEYEIVNTEEYQALQNNIKTALDDALDRIYAASPELNRREQSRSIKRIK